ncbi:MAG: DUF1109 family protein [Hyphomicrobiales bacterium]|nr:DUF1109 family protein [Hyphomicrobiales bacterium]
MNETEDLIGRLSHDLPPVRRLMRPVPRALAWLALASVLLGALALTEGLRADLLVRLQGTMFDLEIAGMVLTALGGTLAAFMLSLPDRSRRWLAAPVPGLVLWLASMGAQCASGWVTMAGSDMSQDPVLRCLATLLLASLPLSLSLVLLLRHVRLLAPLPVALSAAASVAAMAALALTLCHAIDASLMILAFNLGTLLVAGSVAAVLARPKNAGALPFRQA